MGWGYYHPDQVKLRRKASSVRRFLSGDCPAFAPFRSSNWCDKATHQRATHGYRARHGMGERAYHYPEWPVAEAFLPAGDYGLAVATVGRGGLVVEERILVDGWLFEDEVVVGVVA